MIRTLLIANRGEIAARIAEAARDLGIRSVAVYSDADADARHVRVADRAVRIGPAAAAASYLSIEALLDAARRTGADAVHPGYGFLSENADFARAVTDAGMTFVGPPADAIALMGDKRTAKEAATAAGVHGVPGYQGDDDSDERLIAEASAIGFPLMVKATAGGGGRGMRVVHDAAALPDALRSARAEATSSFGSGSLLLERAVLHARHVEIQVFADTHGTVLSLGERDCSLQRRNQKVVEEAPSPAVTPELRAAMGEAACAVARACGYVGAGTVEFLLEPDGRFWFLEMNTRLQVEHPVTEEVTMLDLVQLQLRVAAGEALAIDPEALAPQGHSIEVRIYAEDPDRGFLPQTGRIARFDLSHAVRFDHCVGAGATVSPHYDPMLGKLIAHGQDRPEALRRLVGALEDLVLDGVVTNQAWLRRLLQHPDVASGEVTTRSLESWPAEVLAPSAEEMAETRALAALARFATISGTPLDRLGWRSGRNVPAILALETPGTGQSPVTTTLAITRSAGRFLVDETPVTLHALHLTPHTPPLDPTWDRYGPAEGAVAGSLDVTLSGVRFTVPFTVDGDTVWVRGVPFTDVSTRPAASADGGSGTIAAPLDGVVTSVFVTEGAAVEAGQLLLVMEAMKMEHRMVADIDGTVAELPVRAGDQVTTRQLLARLAPPPPETLAAEGSA